MKFKVGDEITAIFPHFGERCVRLMKITKVGHKYLYGNMQHRDQAGSLRVGHETKVSIEKSDIYQGLRHDLLDLEYKYRKEYQAWQNRRKAQKREIDRGFYEYLQEQLDAWDKENPRPEPPEFPVSEALSL